MALFDLENRGIPSWVEKLKVFTLRNTCCDKSTTKSYERQSWHQNLESYKVYRLWSVDESEAGRFARCPVRPESFRPNRESFRPEYEVVSPGV